MRTGFIFDAYFVAYSLEQAAIQQAEMWYCQRYHRDAQGHLIRSLDDKPIQQEGCLLVDVVANGDSPQRVSVAVDSYSGFVRELAQPIICRYCTR